MKGKGETSFPYTVCGAGEVRTINHIDKILRFPFLNRIKPLGVSMYKIRISNDGDQEQAIAIFNYYIENSMAAYPQKSLPAQAWNFIKS